MEGSYVLWDHWGNWHSEPVSDGIPEIKCFEVCGTVSIKTFMRWFPSRVNELYTDEDFVVNLYLCDEEDVRIGNKQCVFTRENAKLVHTFEFERKAE
jgi:hypothetical protein